MKGNLFLMAFYGIIQSVHYGVRCGWIWILISWLSNYMT